MDRNTDRLTDRTLHKVRRIRRFSWRCATCSAPDGKGSDRYRTSAITALIDHSKNCLGQLDLTRVPGRPTNEITLLNPLIRQEAMAAARKALHDARQKDTD